MLHTKPARPGLGLNILDVQSQPRLFVRIANPVSDPGWQGASNGPLEFWHESGTRPPTNRRNAYVDEQARPRASMCSACPSPLLACWV